MTKKLRAQTAKLKTALNYRQARDSSGLGAAELVYWEPLASELDPISQATAARLVVYAQMRHQWELSCQQIKLETGTPAAYKTAQMLSMFAKQFETSQVVIEKEITRQRSAREADADNMSKSKLQARWAG